MNEQSHRFRKTCCIKPSALPFTGRQLFGQLRHKLREVHRREMTFHELAWMMGTPVSTTHHWFEVKPPRPVLSFMSLLEYLSPTQRMEFIESHCRTLPTLEHSKLRISPVKRAYLYQLRAKELGMTIISGSLDSSRTFLLTAVGHSLPLNCIKSGNLLGLDLHRPDAFVPIQSVCYIDGTQNVAAVRAAAAKIWPRILTSKSPAVLLNGVWSELPELRSDILRLTERKHVILADHMMPTRAEAKGICPEIHFVTISQCKNDPERIRILCRKKRS